MIEWKTVRIDYPRLKGAQGLEDILCLATLVTRVSNNYRLEDAEVWFKLIEHCDFCPFREDCLACIINE